MHIGKNIPKWDHDQASDDCVCKNNVFFCRAGCRTETSWYHIVPADFSAAHPG